MHPGQQPNNELGDYQHKHGLEEAVKVLSPRLFLAFSDFRVLDVQGVVVEQAVGLLAVCVRTQDFD